MSHSTETGGIFFFCENSTKTLKIYVLGEPIVTFFETFKIIGGKWPLSRNNLHIGINFFCMISNSGTVAVHLRGMRPTPPSDKDILKPNGKLKTLNTTD